MLKGKIHKFLLLGSLLAVFVSGCHKPSFEDMEPSSMKWSLSVVSSATSEAEKQEAERLVAEVASQRGLSAEVVYPAEDLDLTALAERTGLDLMLFESKVPSFDELAQKHPELRFSVLGDSSEPKLSNVRHLVHDRKKMLFLAGYLAAEANRAAKEPFTVLVNELRKADDEDWKMLVAGMHYAGRKDVPLQLQMAALTQKEPEGETAGRVGQNGSEQGQPALSGLAIVLLDLPSDKAWEKLKQKNQVIIRTDESRANVPLQERVGAQPASLYEAALRQEAELLASGKWSGQQKVALTGKQTYKVTAPALFPDQQIGVLLELIEERIRTGSIKPDDYVSVGR